MNLTQRGFEALRKEATSRFEPKFVCWGELALVEGLVGRKGRPLRPIRSVAGCEREVQSHHSLRIVGKRVPEQHGARLDQSTHVEALKPAVAQMRVGALDAGRPLLVGQLGRIGAHALAPLAQRLAVAGQRCAPITQLVLGCEHRREYLGGLRFKLFDMPVLGKAPIGQPLVWHPSVAVLVLLMHGQHLVHVAARVDELHARDDHRGGVHRELRIERRAEAAIGHLHRTRLVVGGAHARLLGLVGVFGLLLGRLHARRLTVWGLIVSSRLVLRRLGLGAVGSGLLVLARQALVDLVHRLEGQIDALFALGGGTLARCTHAAGAGTRVISHLKLECFNLGLGVLHQLLWFGAAVIGLATLLAWIGVAETLPWAHAEVKQHATPVAQSLRPRYPTGVSEQPTTREVFALMSWRDRRMAALCQAGLVEKFVDALVWGKRGLKALLFAADGMSRIA
jgi:hypothetical protein